MDCGGEIGVQGRLTCSRPPVNNAQAAETVCLVFANTHD